MTKRLVTAPLEERRLDGAEAVKCPSRISFTAVASRAKEYEDDESFVTQVTQCLAAYSAAKPSWYHTSSSLWATTTPTGTAPDSVKVK